MELAAPACDDEVPAGHDWHEALVVAPAFWLCVPAPHLVHEVWVLELEYVPGMHTGQLVAAEGDDAAEPAGQLWHVVAPALLLTLPMGH